METATALWTAMLVCYALEDRSHWFILAFAGHAHSDRSVIFYKAHGLFGVVEAIWCAVAVRRWWLKQRG
jgi:hypothetical protein